MNKIIKENNFFCPICNESFLLSPYLKDLFKDDEKALWLSNMVTHYRHSHIKSWNKCWDKSTGNRYRQSWFGDYDEEKEKVNERAKRQIIRKSKQYLLDNKIGLETFFKLQSTSEETVSLIKKLL